MTARLCTIAAFAIVLVQCTASVSAQDLSKRQNGNITHFVGTADQINNYDPHDYVPKAYSTVRIVHAVAMSLAYLIIFPIGSILIRVMTYAELIRIHIILQMIGFWIVVAGSAMGIWMAKQIDQVCSYHFTVSWDTDVFAAQSLPPYNRHDDARPSMSPAIDRNRECYPTQKSSENQTRRILSHLARSWSSHSRSHPRRTWLTLRRRLPERSGRHMATRSVRCCCRNYLGGISWSGYHLPRVQGLTKGKERGQKARDRNNTYAEHR